MYVCLAPLTVYSSSSSAWRRRHETVACASFFRVCVALRILVQDTGRKFDCLIFITGTKEMNLPPETETYKKEFDFLANAAVVNLRKDNPEQLDQLIFAEMTYTNRTAAFVTGFGISSIPSAYFLKRDLKVDMQTGTMTPHRAQDRFEVPFTFMAEDFAKVLKNSHDIDVGPVVKPSFFDAWYALPLVGVSLIVLALVGWKVYTSTFIKNPLVRQQRASTPTEGQKTRTIQRTRMNLSHTH